MGRDFDRLAAEVLRGLRDTRSQEAFNRRLGFKSNVAYTWESGRRFPTGPAFLEVARSVGVDVPAAIGAFSGPSDLDWSDPSTLARWLDALRGTTSASALARRAGRNRAVVARWLSGASAPRLPELLLLIDAITDRVLDFASAFVKPHWLVSVQRELEQLRIARELAGASPWTAAVLLALELDAYAEAPLPVTPWLASRLGVSQATVSMALAVLIQAGHVGVRSGRYRRLDASRTVDTRPESALRGFWAQVARERLEGGAPGVSSWNLGVVSAADFDRIEELQRRTFRELRAIVAGSSGADRLVLVNWSLVTLAAE